MVHRFLVAIAFMILGASPCVAQAQRPPVDPRTPAPRVKPRPAQPAVQPPAPAQAQPTVAAAAPASPYQKLTSNGVEFQIGPAPAWVRPADSTPTKPTPAASDRRVALHDDQILIEPGRLESFSRFGIVATSAAALASVGQFSFEFNPDYQRPTIHSIAVLRDGQRLDRLKPEAITMLRRETGLEKSVYNGTVTGSIVIEDVRVGDVVEIAWTVEGANPILQDHFGAQWLLERQVPVDRLRVRLVNRSAKPLAWRMLNSKLAPRELAAEGGGTELVFEADHLRPGRWSDDRAPGWDLPYGLFQVSQFADWSAVRTWADTLFAVPAALPPEARALVERIAKDHATPAARALAALQFVQDEIRYFSISLGVNSHRPADPATVLARRYGDCKDKSLLLVSLLRALEVDAQVALVDAGATRAVKQWLPGQVFDHAIVTALVDGQRLWLDPTVSEEAGGLAERYHPYGAALILDGATGTLADVTAPKDYLSSLATTMRFTAKRYGEPVALHVDAVARGAMAQGIRAYLKRASTEDAARLLDDTYLRLYADARRLDGPAVKDDQALNEITLSARYELPKFFAYSERRMISAEFGVTLNELPMLGLPQSLDRHRAINLAYPARESVQLVLELAHAPPLPTPAPAVEDLGAMQFRHALRYSPGRLVVDWQLDSKSDHIPAARAKQFAERLIKVRETMGRAVNFNVLDQPGLDALRRALEEMESPRSIGRMTPAQRMILGDRFGYRVVSTHIDSGRLGGTVLGQAHLERARIASRLHRFAEALADVDRAAPLMPEAAEATILRAELELYQGRAAEALALLEKIPAAQVSGRHALEFSRGHALYFLDRFGEAKVAFRKDIDDAPSGRRAFSLVWHALAAARQGEDPAALLTESERSQVGSEWPRPILDHLAGVIEAAALLEKAADNDKQKELRQLCEAHFFIAQRQLSKGETAAARSNLQKSVQTQVQAYLEYHFARVELERMAAR